MQPSTRKQFGQLFQTVNELGKGVEVGVQRGFFSKLLSDRWTGKIFCVDMWEDETIENEAKSNLNTEQFTMIKGDSIEVAKTFKDESLDWVYIDAGHSYEEVKADYDAWFSKVRVGGIISGHDYGDNEFGVKKFVDELNKKINLTTEDFWDGKEYQSWWFIK